MSLSKIEAGGVKDCTTARFCRMGLLDLEPQLSIDRSKWLPTLLPPRREDECTDC
jgi:hypothetical protein